MSTNSLPSSFVAFVLFSASACGGTTPAASTTTTPPTAIASASTMPGDFATDSAHGDEEAFTRRALESLVRSFSEGRFDYGGLRTIDVDLGQQHTAQISLDRVYGFCVQSPSECNAAMDEFLSGIVESARELVDESAIDAAHLRVAVRPESWLEGMPDGADLVTRAIGGGLIGVVMFDTPRTARSVSVAELEAIGLAAAPAFNIALANTLAELGRFTPPALTDCEQVGTTVDGQYYESTRLLDPQGFATLAGTNASPLLVSVPSYDLVAFTFSCSPLAPMAFAAVTGDLRDRSRTPLSAAVFRWTPGGFVAIGE